MITVTHKIDCDGVHYSTVHHSDFRTYGFRSSSYAIGFSKPNYQLPAIRSEIEIFPDRVVLWRKGTYWEFMYLASSIPSKLLNRWAE